MEKIYMEKNQDNDTSSYTNKRKDANGIKWTMTILGVAILGIFAIVLKSNIKTSYSMDTTITVPNSITVTANPTKIVGDATSNTFPLFYYYSKINDTTTVPFYCVERNTDFGSGTPVTKDAVVSDYGLLYLLAHSYPYKTFVDDSGKTLPTSSQVWISQTAIWEYLFEEYKDSYAQAYALYKTYIDTTDTTAKATAKAAFLASSCAQTGNTCLTNGMDANGGTTNGLIVVDENTGEYSSYSDAAKTDNSENISTIKDVTTVRYADNSETNSVAEGYYAKYIKDLVANAQTNKTEPSLTLSVPDNSKVPDSITTTTSSDKKNYQTSLITITGAPSDNFVGYSLEIKSGPDGMKVYAEDGTQITDLANISPSTKFYLVVPISNVNDNNKLVKISVTGKFNKYTGYYYKATGAQTTATVDVATPQVNNEINMTFAPDTASSVPTSIYFIGLIILLCGVGIIYANVKPKEQQQQK
jgi:hypothetical protein